MRIGGSARRRAILLVLLALTAFVVWSHLRDSSPDPEPAPTVVRIAAEEIVRLPSADSSTLVLSGHRELDPGWFLTAAPDWQEPDPKAPEGFLLEVRSTEVVDGETVVDVRPASLYEAVPDDRISATAEDFTLMADEKALVLATARASISGADDSADDSQFERSELPFADTIACTNSEELSVDGNVETALEPEFKLRWKRRGLRLSIRRAAAIVNGDLSASATARVGGRATCATRPLTLVEPRWIAVIPVGPVPVPVTFSVPIELKANATVSGEAKVSARAGIAASLGIEYNHGKGVEPHRRFDPYAELTPTVKAGATAGLRVGPKARIKAGWELPFLGGIAAGASVNLAAGVTVTYRAGAEKPASLCFPISSDASIDVYGPLKRKLFTRSVGLLDRDRRCPPRRR